jgi:hypothetical protein
MCSLHTVVPDSCQLLCGHKLCSCAELCPSFTRVPKFHQFHSFTSSNVRIRPYWGQRRRTGGLVFCWLSFCKFRSSNPPRWRSSLAVNHLADAVSAASGTSESRVTFLWWSQQQTRESLATSFAICCSAQQQRHDNDMTKAWCRATLVAWCRGHCSWTRWNRSRRAGGWRKWAGLNMRGLFIMMHHHAQTKTKAPACPRPASHTPCCTHWTPSNTT